VNLSMKSMRPKSDASPFPPPWSIDELEASFVVIDSAGQKLALPRLGWWLEHLGWMPTRLDGVQGGRCAPYRWGR
jgi:hypothetical protein